jgi:3-isopropylmalate/(R)-2-methylmalate dehydratase small subunit
VIEEAMARQIKSHAYCIDGVLDVDWDISPIEDMFFIRDGVALGISEEEQLKRLALNCLTRIDPQFSVKIKKGNILVGHRGVGWGHGHDHAALALKAVGIGAIICETTGANFKRNCINHGLPIIEIPGIFSKVKTGDSLELDLDAGVFRNLSNSIIDQFTTYPEFILEIFDAGDIYEKMRIDMENEDISNRNREEML